MGRMDSSGISHDPLAATLAGLAGTGPCRNQADPPLTGHLHADPGEAGVPGWENFWIDLGGEG